MDAATFKRRFMPWARTMYWTAFRLTDRKDDAEDLVQDVYLRLWTIRDRLPQTESDEAYCLRAVRNAFYDRQRLAHIETSDDESGAEGIADEDNVAQRIEQHELSEVAQRMMEELPEGQREVMKMKDLLDMTIEEISEKTGLTAGNLRVILSRARRTVRQRMEKLLHLPSTRT